MRSFRERLLGALRLDGTVFQEVARDPRATLQALLVVLVSGATAGVPALAEDGGATVQSRATFAILAWAIYVLLIATIGRWLLTERHADATFARTVRALSFASAPGIVRVLGIVAPLRPVAFLLADVWIVACMVVALQQVLGISNTLRTATVCVVAWAVQTAAMLALFGGLTWRTESTSVDPARPKHDGPAAGSIGVVRPSGIAPPVEH